jgi:tyrosine-protein kinase Etk/Wzc
VSEEANHQAAGAASTMPADYPGEEFESDDEENGIALRDLLSLVAFRKRFFFFSFVAGGVLAALVALLMPSTFVATAVLMPPQKEQSAASALLGQMGPLAAATGTDLGLKRPSDLYIGLLGSRTIADNLIGRFGLRELYRTKTLAATYDQLKSHSRFSSARDSLIRIEVEERDPKLAAALANGYTEELNALNKRLAMTDAGERRVFQEGQLRDEKLALSEAEDALKKAQVETGIVQLDGQTTAVIRSMADMKERIAVGEAVIERLRLAATAQNPDLLRAQAEVSGLRAELRKLTGASEEGDPFVATSKLPEKGLTYARRFREVKYHEFLLELLSKQYDAARLDESKAAPDLQVVDTAVPPDRKSGPPRMIIALFGCLSGLLVAGLIAYFQGAPHKPRAARA